MGLGLRAAAAALGITHPALHKAAERGRVPRLPDGTFDVDACRAALAENTNTGKQRSALKQRGARRGAPAPPAPPERRSSYSGQPPEGSQAEADRQKSWIDLEKARLALDEKRHRLVELAPVNAYVAGLIIQARDEMMRIGPELRDRLAQETDPIACEAMVTKRVVSALNKMAEYRPETE